MAENTELNKFISDTKDEINETSIVSLFKRANYLDLKQKGRNFIACCPFHAENTPSFYVSPAKNIYKCFGCGESGDFIKFVEKEENLSFQESILHIATNYLDKIPPDNEFTAKKRPPKKMPQSAEMVKYNHEQRKKLEQEILQFNENSLKNFKLVEVSPEILNNVRGLSPELYIKAYDFKYFVYKDSFGNERTINFNNITHVSECRTFANVYPVGEPKMPKYYNIGLSTNKFYQSGEFEAQGFNFFTEGCFNADAIKEVMPDNNVYSLFASTNQINDVEKFKKIISGKTNIIAFDNDKNFDEKDNAGYKGAITFAKFIYDNFKVENLFRIKFPVKKDANDLLKSGELNDFLLNRENYIKLTKDFINAEYCRIYDLEPPPKSKFDEYFEKSKITDFKQLPDAVPIVFSPVEPDKVVFFKSTVNAVSGRAKARKTSFLTGLCIDAIKRNDNIRILWIDTEQAKFDIKRLIQRFDYNIDNYDKYIDFHSFRVLDIPTSDVCGYVEYCLNKNKYDLFILDNGTDLDPKSIMEIESAQVINKFLLKISEIYELAIVTVVHDNEKGLQTGQGRGHFGSELLRKCHQTIYLTKEDSLTNVEFKTGRYLAPNDFTFAVDEFNMPIWDLPQELQPNADALIITHLFKEKMMEFGFAKSQFSATTQQNAIDILFKTFEYYKCDISKRDIRSKYLPLLEQHEIIKNNGTGNRFAYYVVSPEIPF